MKKFTSKTIVSLFLCCILIVSIVGVSNLCAADNVLTRTVTVSQSKDVDAILAKFDDAYLTENENTITFYAKKIITPTMLSEVDEISFEDDFDENFEYYMEYFEENPPTVTCVVNIDKNFFTFDLVYTIEIDGEETEDTATGFLIENEDGELDGLLCLEGECVLLSEICATGAIDEIGLLSKFWQKLKTVVTTNAKKILHKVYTQVLEVVRVTIVSTAELIGGTVEITMTSVSQQKSTENYVHNLTEAPEIKVEYEMVDTNGYINNQNNDHYAEWKFGYGTIEDNGCGAIATYNVLRFCDLIKNNEDEIQSGTSLPEYRRNNFANIIRSYELSCGTLISGLHGINSGAIAPILRAYGVNVRTYSYFSAGTSGFEYACDHLSSDQIAILCYLYIYKNESEETKFGGHYVTFTKTNGVYTAYNDDDLSRHFIDGHSIGDFFNLTTDDGTNVNIFMKGWVITR